jgi:site-specific DNA-methyltransferase (adenine-specific)
MSAYLIDSPQQMDGLELLAMLPNAFTPLAFFDPQYRGVLDRLEYGHADDDGRQIARKALPQMTTEQIRAFVLEIQRVLKPQGHLMLWLDKFSVMEELFTFTSHATGLKRVDMVTWHKQRIGMGYRTRRACEYLVILQKYPIRAKDVWNDRGIPDVWSESTDATHAHTKPFRLQKRLIEATTKPGDTVIDPASGSYSVFHAAAASGRHFVGCDLNERAQTLPMLFAESEAAS